MTTPHAALLERDVRLPDPAPGPIAAQVAAALVALRPPAPECARCGRVAEGFASIGGERFCHGDAHPRPSCYELAQRERAVLVARLSDIVMPPAPAGWSDIADREWAEGRAP